MVAALAYAALKTAWALGSRIGVTDRAAFARFEAGFGDFAWVATWGTVVLAIVAALLLLTLAERWFGWLPRRPLRAAAWVGAAVLVVPGFGGLAESLLIYATVLDGHDNGMAGWVFLLTYGAFSVLTVALAVTAWHSRPLPGGVLDLEHAAVQRPGAREAHAERPAGQVHVLEEPDA